MVLPDRIELSTSPLPNGVLRVMKCVVSTVTCRFSDGERVTHLCQTMRAVRVAEEPGEGSRYVALADRPGVWIDRNGEIVFMTSYPVRDDRAGEPRCSTISR